MNPQLTHSRSPQALQERRARCETQNIDPVVWTNQRVLKWVRDIDLKVRGGWRAWGVVTLGHMQIPCQSVCKFSIHLCVGWASFPRLARIACPPVTQEARTTSPAHPFPSHSEGADAELSSLSEVSVGGLNPQPSSPSTSIYGIRFSGESPLRIGNHFDAVIIIHSRL